MANILIPLYLFLGVVYTLLVLITWYRNDLDIEEFDGEEGCVVVIISIAVFIVLPVLWLPVLIALRLSKYTGSDDKESEESEESEGE